MAGRLLVPLVLVLATLATIALTSRTTVAPIEAVSLDASSVRISWTAPRQAVSVDIFRDGRLIDSVPASGTRRFIDHLLWAATPYNYTVKAFAGDGTPVMSHDVNVVTKPFKGAFPRLYSPESFWNKPIPDDPRVEPRSSEVVAKALAEYASSANFANTDKWGTPLTFANPGSTKYDIACTEYGCDTPLAANIPTSARPSTGSDGHLVVIEPSSHEEVDLWQASYHDSLRAWSAGSRYRTTSNGMGAMCAEGSHCNSAVASGFAAFAGVIRPEEVAQGHIDHALAITTPYTRAGFIACPATHTDGAVDSADALPEGARVQLDPTVDVASQQWPRWMKVIAETLQKYGAYVVDTGGTVALKGEPNISRGYDAWAKAGVPVGADLSPLPWDRVRLLALRQC